MKNENRLPRAAEDSLPLFSVIVPVYNTSDYLVSCLQSIFAQEECNFEVIAVDDGSTDNSLQILKHLAARDARLRVFSKDNGGQGAARNLGLSKARGAFVAFVDSDDTVSPALFSQLAPHLSDPELDVVSFGIAFRNSANQTVASRSTKATFVSTGEEIYLDAMLDNNFLSVVWNKVYRRSLLTDNKIEFPPLRAYEDSVFSRHVAWHARKVLYINQPLYFALTRSDSTSRSMSVRSFSMAAEMIDLEREMFYVSTSNPMWRAAFKAHIARFFAYLIVLSAFRIDDGAERKACLEIADGAGFFNCAGDESAVKLLGVRAKALIFLAKRPSLLRIMAVSARRINLVPY